MEIEIKVWVFDVLSAIKEIEIFLNDTPDFEAYQGDLKTKRAIERNLEIVGEAMNRILKAGSVASFTDARKIVETRNRIIHGYDAISDEIIWSIIKNSLPTLKQEAEQFLGA